MIGQIAGPPKKPPPSLDEIHRARKALEARPHPNPETLLFRGVPINYFDAYELRKLVQIAMQQAEFFK